MPRRPLLVVCVIALASHAFAEEPALGRPAGLTAADIRVRPTLTREARTAMREVCEARLPACDPIAVLGTLERAALVRALEERGLAVEPTPAGKLVRRLHVITIPVFGEDEKIFRWANFFHVSSKEHVVEREVLMRPGQVYDHDKVDETSRKLRDPLFTSLAVVVPVVAVGGGPGEVDLLVVTRDIFSLRMNTNYEFQDGTFTFLTVSLSENNFLGRRMLLAIVFIMDQGSLSLGPLYIDKNFLGKRLEVRGRGGPLFNRGSLELEGSSSSFAVSRPLWSLDSEWSWGVDWSHRFAIERSFRGNDLRTYDAPSTPDDDLIPYQYEQRYWSVGATVVRQLGGDDLKHRFKGGYDLTSQRPELLAGTTGADSALEDFRADVLPRDERTGVVYAAYEVFTPRYREYRDIDSFDLAEDTRLGPRFQVLAGTGLRVLASDANFGKLSVEGGWTVPLGKDGVGSVAGSLSTRIEDGAMVDRVASVTVRATSPPVLGVRANSEVRLAGVFRDESNRFLYLGGDSGLRGYPVNFIDGDRRAIWQTELRTRSVRLFLGSRWGALAFYDAGAAADQVEDLRLFQDVGIGIRALGPQLSPEVFRFDIAFPLTAYGTASGLWPPRISAGYRQAF